MTALNHASTRPLDVIEADSSKGDYFELKDNMKSKDDAKNNYAICAGDGQYNVLNALH